MYQIKLYILNLLYVLLISTENKLILLFALKQRLTSLFCFAFEETPAFPWSFSLVELLQQKRENSFLNGNIAIM